MTTEPPNPLCHPELVVAQLPDGDAVASLPSSGDAVVLNTMGSAIIELCDGSRTIEQIAAFVCEHIKGVELPTVRADITALLARLREAGLIVDTGDVRSEIEGRDEVAAACGPSPSEG